MEQATWNNSMLMEVRLVGIHHGAASISEEWSMKGLIKEEDGEVTRIAQTRKSRAPVWVLTARAVNTHRSSGERAGRKNWHRGFTARAVSIDRSSGERVENFL